MSVEIALASLSDAEAILALQRRAFLSEARFYNNYTIPPMIQTLDELKADFSNHVFLKAEISGELAGSVKGMRIDDSCHIGRLIVEPNYQGRGLGKQLMRAIEANFPDVVQFCLFTGYMSEWNLSLYRKLGYTEVRREVAGPDMQFVHMSKFNQDAGTSWQGDDK